MVRMERVGCLYELPPLNFEGSSIPGTTSSVDGTGGALLNKCDDPWTVVRGMASEVHELLGLGSFSYVYSCSMQGIDGRVAVKLLARCHDQHLNENREVVILTQLQHPNLVALLNVVEGPPHALVLELCVGGSLQDLLHGARFGKKKTLQHRPWGSRSARARCRIRRAVPGRLANRSQRCEVWEHVPYRDGASR